MNGMSLLLNKYLLNYFKEREMLGMALLFRYLIFYGKANLQRQTKALLFVQYY